MSISNMLHKIIKVGVIFAFLSEAALAQLPMPGIPMSPDQRRTLTPEEKEKQKLIDEQYRATMKDIPDKRAPTDPWSNMRSAPAAQSKQRQQ